MQPRTDILPMAVHDWRSHSKAGRAGLALLMATPLRMMAASSGQP